MNYCFLTIILVLSVRITRAQNFLNGSFENNAAVSDTLFSSEKLASMVPGTNGISGMFQLVTSDDYCGTAVDGSWFFGGFNNQISEFTMTLDTPMISGSLYQLNMWMRSCLNLGGLVTMKMGVSNNDSTFGSLVEIFSPPDDSWTFQSLVFTAPLTSKYISFTFDPVYGGFIELDGMSLSPATVINQVASTGFVDCFPNPFTTFSTIHHLLYHPVKRYFKFGNNT